MTTQTSETVERSAWNKLPLLWRRIVTVVLVSAFVQLVLVNLYFRLQELPEINKALADLPHNLVADGIQYPPMVVSTIIFAALMVTAVVIVSSKSRGSSHTDLGWLGSAWLIACIVLALDLLIDTFEVKWPIIILFAHVGTRYWKGVRQSFLGLILAPAVAVIAALDGLNHASGQDCVANGLDACPGKAVSDIYLVVILLILTYLTIQPFLSRPGSRASQASA